MREIKFRAWNGSIMYSPSIEGTCDISEYLNEINNVMQYTGLKDKNGVDIYESDLLQVNDNYFKIEFSNGCFWGIPYKCTNLITKSDKHPLGQILHYVFEDDICEVIGNIYENPELLENQ